MQRSAIFYLSAFFVAAACSACLAGQRPLPAPPAHLSALPDAWKEMVFQERTKRGKAENWEKNMRILFLDPPVPCTVRIKKKGLIAIGQEIKQGYGGVFIEKMASSVFFSKRKNVDKDATLYFYIIDPASGAVSIYSREQLEYAKVEPPIVTIETVHVKDGRKIEMMTLIRDPRLRLEAAAFRAMSDVKTFDELPQYK